MYFTKLGKKTFSRKKQLKKKYIKKSLQHRENLYKISYIAISIASFSFLERRDGQPHEVS